jgi:hypothetical protein
MFLARLRIFTVLLHHFSEYCSFVGSLPTPSPVSLVAHESHSGAPLEIESDVMKRHVQSLRACCEPLLKRELRERSRLFTARDHQLSFDQMGLALDGREQLRDNGNDPSDVSRESAALVQGQPTGHFVHQVDFRFGEALGSQHILPSLIDSKNRVAVRGEYAPEPQRPHE